MSTSEGEIEKVRIERVPVYTDPDVPLAINALANRVGSFLRERRRCCPTCSHFNDKNEQCGLAKARPPAQVIAYGCDSHDYMPF